MLWDPDSPNIINNVYNGKITHHSDNQDNHSLNKKRWSTDANTETDGIVRWAEKNFRAAIIKVLQGAMANTITQLRK